MLYLFIIVLQVSWVVQVNGNEDVYTFFQALPHKHLFIMTFIVIDKLFHTNTYS